MRFQFGLWSLTAIAAACGGGGSGPTGGGGNPPPGSAVVNVSMTDNGGLAPYAFSPATPTITVGTTVKWTNSGTTAHTTTSDSPGWDSDSLAPRGSTTCDPYGYNCQPGSAPGTFQQTFMTAGTYQYHCQFHVAQGMTGTITVTPAP